MLREQGYATGGFASVTLLDQASGAARGFDTFVNPKKPRERPGEVAVQATLDWLTGIPWDRSFFGWVHLFDPHLPYGPPAGFLDSVDPQLADVRAVHLRRTSVAKAQKDSIDDSLFRLERSALLTLSQSNGESDIRVKEVILDGESEGKTFYEVIESNRAFGWCTFDDSILELFQEGQVVQGGSGG